VCEEVHINMAKTTGYKLRHKYLQNTHVCTECAKATNLKTNNLEEQDTGKIASFICIVCEKDITKGDGNSKRDYPEELVNLFETRFIDEGPRFGGVNPRRDSGNKRKEVGASGAATMSDATRTSYDPVVFQVEDEKLANSVSKFISQVSSRGPIRGRREDIEGYEIPVYDFEIWYNQ